jgi:hypothetical protein
VELFPHRRDKITAEPVKMQKKPDEPKKIMQEFFRDLLISKK